MRCAIVRSSMRTVDMFVNAPAYVNMFLSFYYSNNEQLIQLLLTKGNFSLGL